MSKKDYWDKVKIVFECMSFLAIPFLTIFLWIKGNEIQELFKNKDTNSNRFELFMSLYPKLISKDSIERKAAGVVIEQLAYSDTNIDFESIEYKILALIDPNLAKSTMTNIVKSSKSDNKSKQNAESVLVDLIKQNNRLLGLIDFNSNGQICLGGYQFSEDCQATIYYQLPSQTKRIKLTGKIILRASEDNLKQCYNELKHLFIENRIEKGTTVIISLDNGNGYYEGTY
jgi:hypothetical protein